MKNKSQRTIIRLGKHILPYWPVLALGLIANILFSAIDAGFTFMLKPFMNKGFIDKDMAFIQWVPLMIFAGICLRGCVNAIGSYSMTWVARSVIKKTRGQVFDHLLKLPASTYDKLTSGQMIAKLLYDVEQIAQVSSDAITTFVQSLCLVIGLLIVMFIISWQLSAFFLTTMPFVALIVRYTNRRIRRVSHQVQESMGEVTQIAEEAIEGYKVVRIFNAEQYESNKFHRALETSRKRDMKVALTQALNTTGVQMVIACGIGMIIFTTIKLSAVIAITAGGFLSIMAAMLQLIKPMKNLTTVTSVIQRGLAGADSVFSLLDKPIEPNTGRAILTRATGKICFNQVRFAYPGQATPALNDISFEAAAGSTVAIVGRSGSGKSSLVNLLTRFYEPASGEVLLDGINIHDICLDNLRQQFALVSQHVTLFNDTIANNIAYGMTDVSEAAIMDAATHAHALEFIEKLPEGIHTLVGENGLLLSGGQRQRLAIARAILKNAPVLVLDEATSALDTESERLIQAALEGVMKNRTTIVIAHRLSTIEKADSIIVLERGRVVEQGSHQVLLQAGGYYSNLYQLQFQELPSHA